MPAVVNEAPPLPAGSIDFNALHDAIKAGKSADEALIACGAKAPEEAEAPADEADAAPAAAGKK